MVTPIMPAKHRDAERTAASPPPRRRDHQRHHAEDEGERGHQDGRSRRRFAGCVAASSALALLLAARRTRRSGSRSSPRGRPAPPGRPGPARCCRAPQPHADHGRQHTHRRDQDDGERQQPAFVHRRQQEEDEDHRKPEGDRGVLPTSFSCSAISVHSKPKPSGRFSRGDRLHGGDRLAGRERPAQAHPALRPRGTGCSAARDTGRSRPGRSRPSRAAPSHRRRCACAASRRPAPSRYGLSACAVTR